MHLIGLVKTVSGISNRMMQLRFPSISENDIRQSLASPDKVVSRIDYDINDDTPIPVFVNQRQKFDIDDVRIQKLISMCRDSMILLDEGLLQYRKATESNSFIGFDGNFDL